MDIKACLLFSILLLSLNQPAVAMGDSSFWMETYYAASYKDDHTMVGLDLGGYWSSQSRYAIYTKMRFSRITSTEEQAEYSFSEEHIGIGLLFKSNISPYLEIGFDTSDLMHEIFSEEFGKIFGLEDDCNEDQEDCNQSKVDIYLRGGVRYSLSRNSFVGVHIEYVSNEFSDFQEFQNADVEDISTLGISLGLRF
jgi:opacity protein-like surface antigen